MSLDGTTYNGKTLANRQYNSFFPAHNAAGTVWIQRVALVDGSVSIGTLDVGAVEIKDDDTNKRAQVIAGTDIAGTMDSLVVAVSNGTVSSSGGTMDSIGTVDSVGTVDSIGTMDSVGTLDSVGTVDLITTVSTLTNVASGTVQAVGADTDDSAASSDGFMSMGLARSAQKDAVAQNDAVRIVANLNGELVISGHTWATTSNREEEVDPLSQQYVEEELVDTTNVGTGTSYYPSSAGVSMAGYKDLSVQLGLVDADGTLTWTLEVTNDDAASPDWIDITKAGYRADDNSTGNTSVVSTSDATAWVDFDNLNCKKFRNVVTISGATNSIQIHTKKKSL